MFGFFEKKPTVPQEVSEFVKQTMLRTFPNGDKQRELETSSLHAALNEKLTREEAGNLLVWTKVLVGTPKTLSTDYIAEAIYRHEQGRLTRSESEFVCRHIIGGNDVVDSEKSRVNIQFNIDDNITSNISGTKTKGKTILHVEGEEGWCTLIREELEDEGYVVYSAMTAEEGLVLLQSSPPDLIISDIQLPGMSGIEFLRVCKEKYPNIPFIINSSYNQYDLSGSPVDDFIVISPDLYPLKAAIKKLLFPTARS